MQMSPKTVNYGGKPRFRQPTFFCKKPRFWCRFWIP